jgi:hypothetical protein
MTTTESATVGARRSIGCTLTVAAVPTKSSATVATIETRAPLCLRRSGSPPLPPP